MWKEFKSNVLYANGGIVLLLFIGVHIVAKAALNRLVLLLKSESNLPFTNKRELLESFYHINN